MILIDTNILVYVHRGESRRHKEYLHWFEETLSSGLPFGVPSVVRSSFVRLVTNPRIYVTPTSMETALRFLEGVLERENHIEVNPGKGHWAIFSHLCRLSGIQGDLVPDAYLAALAMECGGEWITADKDYARFPGLRWRHPLDGLYKPEGRSGPAAAREPRRRYRSRVCAAAFAK